MRWLVAFALVVFPQSSFAQWIAGDSHCVGLSQTANIKSVARVGSLTREVAKQLQKIPEGETVIVCAGTNDAPSRLAGLHAAVNAVLAEAKERKQRLIWIGPINTPLWWDGYSDQADTYLALRLAPDYVSLRAIAWGPGEHDGVFHLTRKGHARLWAIVKGKLQ